MAKLRRHIIILNGERVNSFRDDFESSSGNTNSGRHRYRLKRSVLGSILFYDLIVTALVASVVYVLFGEEQIRYILKTMEFSNQQQIVLTSIAILLLIMYRVIYLLMTHEHRTVANWIPVKAKVLGFAVARKRQGSKIGKIWILNIYFELKRNPYIAKGNVYMSHMQKEFKPGEYIPILVDPHSSKHCVGMVIDPRIMKRV